MTNSDLSSDGPSHSPSLAEASRNSWAWLDALGRSLGCTILLVTRDGTAGPLVGATALVPDIRLLVDRHDAAFMQPILATLETGSLVRASMESFTLVARRLTVQDAVVGAIAVAMPKGSAPTPTTDEAPFPDLDTIETWLTAAVEAHLGQRPPEEEEESFDRLSSLHRLLQDAVESGSQADLVTAFAEALFAWDGVEVTGYFTDVREIGRAHV